MAHEVEFYCQMDFSHYPVDTHRHVERLATFRMIILTPCSTSRCPFLFASKEFGTDKIVFKSTLFNANTDSHSLRFQPSFSKAYTINYVSLQVFQKHRNLLISFLHQTWTNSLSYSWSGFDLHLSRMLRPYAFNVYLPSGILVAASWISFLIPIEMVPGR